MVKKITSLTGSGMHDWLIQRVSAIVLAVYTLFLVVYCMAYSPLHYEQWSALFAHPLMRVASFIAMLSIVYHTWVGMWTVLTDYIKCTTLRLTLHTLIILALFGYLAWCTAILWGL